MRVSGKPAKPRGKWRLRLMQWRTVAMLEKIDKDAENAVWDRDVEIPKLLRHLAGEKQELIKQLSAIANELGEAPVEQNIYSPGIPQ